MKIPFFSLRDEAQAEAYLYFDKNVRRLPRKFKLEHPYSLDPQKPIVVIEENETGRNELFLDVASKIILTREEFVVAINTGQYPEYEVSEIANISTPMSKPDGLISNNLG